MAYTSVIKNSSLSNFLTHPLARVIGGSLFLALCAQMSIPLPFTPIPFTFHMLGILLLGIALGSKQAALSTCLYLTEGALGLPVFAGGLSLASISVTSGYLIGMPLAAYIAGYASKDKSNLYNFILLATAAFVVLSLGAIVLSTFVGAENALTLGVYPFIPGDLLKALIALSYLKIKKRFE